MLDHPWIALTKSSTRSGRLKSSSSRKHPLKNLKGFLNAFPRPVVRSPCEPLARFSAETIGKIDSSIRMSSSFWVADMYEPFFATVVISFSPIKSYTNSKDISFSPSRLATWLPSEPSGIGRTRRERRKNALLPKPDLQRTIPCDRQSSLIWIARSLQVSPSSLQTRTRRF